MTPLDIACITALLLITATQVVLVARFARICRHAPGTPADGAACLSPARMILCLRGSDPFLGDTIRAAVTQDHPDYELRVIVDSQADPAWADVEAALAAAQPRCRVVVEPLARRPATSSLKCASLLQGLRDAERNTAMVAFLDADVVPPPTWLRSLGTALAADGCGVATGNRWYAPPSDDLGSWTRAGWNAGALVQMVCFGIPWGGTLAIESGLLASAGLREKWAAAFCEDTLLTAALAGTGRRVAFLPALIAVNREQVTFGALLPWITRQLLTARLYHPAWPVVAVFGLSAPLAVAAPAVAPWLAIAHGDAVACGGLAAALGAFLASLPALFLWIERIVRRAVPGRWPAAPARLTDAIRGTFAAQAVYGGAILEALTLTSTRWRGVTYAIGGPWDIRVVADDDPPAAAPQPARLHSM
ncbi:MAG: glycosyltransferase [Planctomycetia bacterium]